MSFVQIASSAVVSLCTTTRPRLLEAVAATRGTATRSAEVVKRMAIYVINYRWWYKCVVRGYRMGAKDPGVADGYSMLTSASEAVFNMFRANEWERQ